MTARTWQAGDRVAERDGDNWWLGTIVDIDRDLLAIRFDGGERAGFLRLASSSRLAALDDVPIDERHWLSAKVRDQLVRQEAAARLREMWASLPDDCAADGLLDVAHRLDGYDAHGAPDPHWKWVAAARALLNPATTPTPEGAHS